ncbi:MAG: type II toxin-antitoxin system RelE/ParE family toxin [Micropepsaceae bacterium]
MAWSVETLDQRVDEELLALPADMQARFLKIGELIEAKGLSGVREPHVKHLTGKLWEMRMSGRDGIARALYQAASGQRVVVVRIFVKKTQKTPQSEIDTAQERAKEIKT